MTLKLEVARRLAYIRYLHQLGVDQARLPEPLSSASILMLHDAAESFLGLACEHFDVEPPREFEKHWNVLAAKLPSGGLAVAQGMKRLNKIRVALKHHGSHPSSGSIEQAISDTSTFMTANTQLVFGVDYDTVSMVDVISQPKVHHLAGLAQDATMRGDYVLAMMRIRKAFDQLFSEHDPSNWAAGELPFAFGPPLASFRPSQAKIAELLADGAKNYARNSGDYRRLAENPSKLMEIAEKTQAGIRIAAVGIDYPSYLRFMNLTPGYIDTLDGTRHWRAQTGYAPDRDTWSFALQFVVTTSLRIAAAEAHVTEPTWVTRDAFGRVQWEGLIDEPFDHDDAAI